MYAKVFEPDFEEWKQEIFPVLLNGMIWDCVKERLSSDGHIDDLAAFNGAVKEYVAENIDSEVLMYFEYHGYIEPYVDEHYNWNFNMYERHEYPVGTEDLPEEYTDLETLCPALPDLIDSVTREIQAERLVRKIETITESAKNSGQ